MTDNWKEGLSQEKIDKAASFGDILPQLPLPTIESGKTSSTETLYVKVVSNPKLIKNVKFTNGEAWVCEVEHQGAKKQIFVPNSLRFGLAKECKIHSMEEPAGHHFVIGSHLRDTDFGKNTKLYWCQYKSKDAIEQEKVEERQQQEINEISKEQEYESKKNDLMASDGNQQVFSPEEGGGSTLLNEAFEKVSRNEILESFGKSGNGFSREDITEMLIQKGFPRDQAVVFFDGMKNEGMIFELSPGIWKCIS